MKNYYRLTKKELSYFSSIEEPIVSSCGLGRLSRPVVLVYMGDRVAYVWTLACFRAKLRYWPHRLSGYRFEIRSMY